SAPYPPRTSSGDNRRARSLPGEPRLHDDRGGRRGAGRERERHEPVARARAVLHRAAGRGEARSATAAAAGQDGLTAASSAPEQTTAAAATAVGAAGHVEGPADAAARGGAVAAVGS